jgi:D-glycero-alpha-D-manno-heptose-7-phosphate kinase
MLNNRLLMFFTGFTRLSSEIQKTNRIAAGDKNAQLLEMYRLVDEAEAVLTGQTGDLDEFGRLLDVTWRLKRQTGAKVSTDSIDGIYEKGLAAGALGGKLLGAGGGGFLLFYVPEEKQPAVMEAMKDLLHVPFRFEDGGTRVIHYTPELYDLNEARN